MMNLAPSTHDEFARLRDDWEGASRYLPIFIDESLETIDELTEALLALEANGGRKHIEQLFIAAHRIKGSAASIGLNRVAKLAHLMEDLLQALVGSDRPLPPPMADGLLACTDGLRHYVNALRAGQPEEDHFGTLAQQLLQSHTASDAVSTAPPTEPAAAMRPEPPPSEPTAAVKSSPTESRSNLRQRLTTIIPVNDHDRVLMGYIVFEPNLPLAGLKARLISSKLSNLGNLCHFDPPLDDLDTLEEISEIHFGVVTDSSPAAVRQSLQVAGVQQLTVEPLEQCPPSDKPDSRSPSTTTESGLKPTETLRVDIERLDRLMNLAGQLAIGKARMTQIGNKLRNAVNGGKSAHVLHRASVELKKIAGGTNASATVAELDDFRNLARRLHDQLETVQREMTAFSQAHASVNELFESIDQLDSVSSGIQQSVMDMRMLPIGPLFTRFHRVIRDITRSNGRDIRLLISGEKTELDKRMIDELGDPLIHMIRNAADHGIESPEVRAAAGKPRQGTISLDACHRGSNIVIRISDDGKGLDANRIRAKAVEKGLLSAADAETMTSQQAYQLIWLPGLSTADKVTDVSGRGVGMDIVRSKIKELNGAVDVESEPGRGTTFTIKLPLTLAILPSLMVEIDRDVFALPLESVVEIVRVGRRDMTTVHGHWTVPLRDRVIAVLTLTTIFNWHCRGTAGDVGEDGDITLVVIGEGNRQLGLPVHRVLGEEDVVIKSIADNYRNIAGIAGASVLGDGRISLILDPATLIEMSSHPVVATAKP